MDAILLLIRIGLFAVFAVAGVGKLLDLAGSEKAVKDFGVPEEFAKPLSIALPVAEIAVALLLLPTSTAWFGALGAFLLLAVFTAGMIWQIKQGNAPDCHCFGAIHSEPVSPKSLARNVAIAAFALLLVVRGWNAQGLSFAELSNELALGLFFGLGALALFGAAVHYLKQISERQTDIIRRFDVMELVARADAPEREVEREDLSDPHDGLPIGAPFPDFELADVGGRLVTFENLLMRVKPLLFFFVGPTCNPCQALLPEIEAWQEELKGKVEIVLVSRGDARENAEKFGGRTIKQILLQKDREVAELVRAKWTPTALFVNADGEIASHIAAGDTAIRELVEQIKRENLDREYVFFTGPRGAHDRPPKIGQSVPDVVLRDLDGREIKPEDFRGRRTLVTFWSTSCTHCAQMIEELRRWDREKGADEPALIVFSQGDPEEHRRFGLGSPIVLDEGYRTAEKFGALGTPSAIMINEHGVFASEIAVGAPNIWALLGKRK